jgi:hypothetical protein
MLNNGNRKPHVPELSVGLLMFNLSRRSRLRFRIEALASIDQSQVLPRLDIVLLEEAFRRSRQLTPAATS